MNSALKQLLQQPRRLFLTDGGIETTLIFDDGFDLPYFAAFDLLRSPDGRAGLVNYYERFLKIAVARGTGFILESPTWRSNRDWGAQLGYSSAELADANRDAIRLMSELRACYERAQTPIVISGCIGPRGDGYAPERVMNEAESEDYHSEQVGWMVEAGAEIITAITMTHIPEAIGVARASARFDAPVVISFTVETDGRLPTGQSLKDAIRAVDETTGEGPAYFMINCAHPTHFRDALEPGAAWALRIGGVRGNASTKSHAELDDSSELDRGDVKALALDYRDLQRRFPNIRVLRGCCGTDHTHIDAIGATCLDAEQAKLAAG